MPSNSSDDALAAYASSTPEPAAPRLVASADLAAALHGLADAAPAADTVVEVDVPLEPRLQAFLRERGRPSGGWLNRSWAVPLGELGALARLADECGPQPARVFRHAVPDPQEPARLWVTGGARREPPTTPAAPADA